MKKKKANRSSTQTVAIRHALAIGLLAMVIALPVGLASQSAVKELTLVSFSLAVLFIVILVGILFDVVGVAAAAADLSALSARAACGVFGARRAVQLVRNAHQVASFCNDVVGDVSGALSGTIGTTIVLQLLLKPTPKAAVWATSVMTAFIALVVVGGKAYGKVYAIRCGTEIIFNVGRGMEVVIWIGSRCSPTKWLRR